MQQITVMTAFVTRNLISVRWKPRGHGTKVQGLRIGWWVVMGGRMFKVDMRLMMTNDAMLDWMLPRSIS